MKPSNFRRLAWLGLTAIVSSVPAAEDWPEFRGPTGQGISKAKNVPIHWSATSNEIADAYHRLRGELHESQPVYLAAPEACKRMAARIELAWETLASPHRRDTYRRQTFPDINFQGVEDLLEKKHRALELKDRSAAQAREVQDRLQEISRTRSKKPPPG